MRYPKVTKTAKITYKGGKNSGNLIIKAYFDSDWASNHTTRK